MKISIQNCHFKCICWLPSSRSEYYLFLHFRDNTEEVIRIFCGLLMDIFIHPSYLMKHLFLFIEADTWYLLGTQNVCYKAPNIGAHSLWHD